VHGWGKIARGAEAMAPAFVKMGYEHPIALIYLLVFVEFFGGLAIAAGLFTRFFAAAVTIEMAVITFVHYWPNGFSWLNRATSSRCCGVSSRSPFSCAAAGPARSTAASASSSSGVRPLSSPQTGGAAARRSPSPRSGIPATAPTSSARRWP